MEDLLCSSGFSFIFLSLFFFKHPRVKHDGAAAPSGAARWRPRPRLRPAVRGLHEPPALHSNPITAVKLDYVSSNAMIEHNGRALAAKHANTQTRVSSPSRRCVACENNIEISRSWVSNDGYLRNGSCLCGGSPERKRAALRPRDEAGGRGCCGRRLRVGEQQTSL